ncbi:Inositol oxygenase 2 [Camellia lanceoleosa]|uniref:Inositol oxygenase 2 n=1 Tax=Camellia lanceoleosa TaxID=1840588 RepID=A0ACC0J638_9ERIC|nr:Inositol oxygenase 2 [Camellia lanceoleosa]
MGSQGEDKRVLFDNNDLVLHEGFPVPKSVQDTGFDAPKINSFGHSFRAINQSSLSRIDEMNSNMKKLDRDYDAKSERQQTVKEFYRVNHINQTYDFVSSL